MYQSRVSQVRSSWWTGPVTVSAVSALTSALIGVPVASAEILNPVPSRGINYLMRGNYWQWFDYHGHQCHEGEQCGMRCDWSTSLVPDCFNLDKLIEDLDMLKMMNVRHVRLAHLPIYVLMEWDRQQGYVSYDHAHYGSAMVDNLRTVLDLLDQRGMKATVVMMHTPAGAELPNPPYEHFFRQFFECFETVEGPGGTIEPKYPLKYDSLKRAPAEFVAMFQDDPRIIGWELYGEINGLFFSYGNYPTWGASWDFLTQMFVEMRQNIEALWPPGQRTQNISTNWCCYNPADSLWWDETVAKIDEIVDFYMFSYYNSSASLWDYSEFGTTKEVGFGECGSDSGPYPPLHLYGMNRVYNVTALFNLWDNMETQGYLPRIFNPWAVGDDSIIWPRSDSHHWLIDAWALRTLYAPDSVIEGPFTGGQILFAGVDNYYTITDAPTLVGIPKLMRTTGVEIAHCWERDVCPKGSWNIKCCCLDVFECDCEMCETVPCLIASPPPTTSVMTFASDTLTELLNSSSGNFTTQNNLLPSNVTANRRITFDVNLLEYEASVDILESSARASNLSHVPVVVDDCRVNDLVTGLAGYQQPIEIHISQGDGATINFDIEFAYAGEPGSGGPFDHYRVVVSTPLGDTVFYVPLTDIEEYPGPGGEIYRAGRLDFDCTIPATPASMTLTGVWLCAVDEDCNDGDVCTFDQCVVDACANTPIAYGDVDANGTVNIFDVFCVLNGFGGQFEGNCTLGRVDIEPCEGNGTVNIFDLFAVLNAFGGVDPCCSGSP